jgi:hypothetical protein
MMMLMKNDSYLTTYESHTRSLSWVPGKLICLSDMGMGVNS